MSIKQVSTTWFSSRPVDYDSIHLSDTDDDDDDSGDYLESSHHQTAVDSQSYQEKISSSDSDLEELYFNKSKSANIQSKTVNNKLQTSGHISKDDINEKIIGSSLTGSLKYISKGHFDSSEKAKQKKEIDEIQTELQFSKSYFPENEEYDDDDDVNEINSIQVKTEEEEDPLLECLRRSTRPLVFKEIDTSTYNHLNKKSYRVDGLYITEEEQKLRNSAKVRPIDENALKHLNNMVPKPKKEKPKKPFQTETAKKIAKRAKTERKEKQKFKLDLWDSNPLPDNPPQFLTRKATPRTDFKIEPLPVQKSLGRTSYEKGMVPPKIEEIEKVKKKPIPDNPPKFFDVTPEQRRKRIKEHVKQKMLKKQLAKGNVPTTNNDDLDKQLYFDEEEEKLDHHSIKESLKEILEQDAQEWQEPPAHSPASANKTSEDDESQDFNFPDDISETSGESQDTSKPRPFYIDPHQTTSTKLRNQAIRQRLALIEEQKRLEAEHLREQERKRRETAREIAPNIKKLEQMSTYKPTSLEQKLEEFNKVSHEKNVELITALTEVKFQEPMISTEAKKLIHQGKECSKERKEKEKKRLEEHAKLQARGQRKKDLLDLWKI